MKTAFELEMKNCALSEKLDKARLGISTGANSSIFLSGSVRIVILAKYVTDDKY